MPSKTVITSITLSDGTRVDVPEVGVILFVGPNNAGKSQALRDISLLVSNPDKDGIVVRSLDADYQGNHDDLKQRFIDDATLVQDKVQFGKDNWYTLASVLSWWDGNRYFVGDYFVLLADTETRLQASRPAEALDLYEKTPSHSLHHLYMRTDLEKRLDSISRDAFGRGLILDTWAGGAQWALRVGEIHRPATARPDETYLAALKELPLLHDQGDGVRSMVGLLLDLMTGHQSISLVDEPEAFLHPPQARYLAKLLSEDSASADRTTFLSTHSSDVVHGVLEGEAPTTVIRLKRAGAHNEAAVLNNEAVRRLWSDPLLRYSNLLEGLFTDAVVVCESDADCKFFASIRDSLAPVVADSRRPDILFTSCGGKHRMHVAVEALRAASVPVVVIGDFDVLNDWRTLSRLVEAAGGSTSNFEPDWRILNSALTSTARTPSKIGLKEAVESAIENLDEVTTKSLSRVRNILKIENGWDRVKNTGLAGVPKGDPHLAATRLIDNLRPLGIHLIPSGEMEDFVPSVGGHGPSWLADLLDQRLHESDQTDSAREFFKSVLLAISHCKVQTNLR